MEGQVLENIVGMVRLLNCGGIRSAPLGRTISKSLSTIP